MRAKKRVKKAVRRKTSKRVVHRAAAKRTFGSALMAALKKIF